MAAVDQLPRLVGVLEGVVWGRKKIASRSLGEVV